MYGVPGKVGGLLNGADVGEKYVGVCVSDTPEEIKLKVGLLSSEPRLYSFLRCPYSLFGMFHLSLLMTSFGVCGSGAITKRFNEYFG